MSVFENITLNNNKNKWLVLYSGGLDSIVLAHLLHYLDKDVTLLHMNYGQQAEKLELDLTQQYADHINVPVINMNVEDTFANILTQLNTSLAQVSRLWDEDAEGGGVEDAESSMSYVPFRNTLFLTISGMVCEQLGINNITFGSNLSETMTYSDNSEPFIRTMDKMVKLGSNQLPLNVRAPLFSLTKTKLIELGAMIGTPFELSSSCYFPINGKSCGKCGSCTLRINAFERANVFDPDTNACHDSIHNTIKETDKETVIEWLSDHQVTMELIQ